MRFLWVIFAVSLLICSIRHDSFEMPSSFLTWALAIGPFVLLAAWWGWLVLSLRQKKEKS